jgi:intracellular sulfur oxidation DsrE/DsrF family protein
MTIESCFVNVSMSNSNKYPSTRTCWRTVEVKVVVPLKKDLLVSKDPAAYLSKDSRQETMALKILTGRREVLRAAALSVVTGTVGVASAGATPATAAVDSALMPPGATHLEALKKRLAQAPRRRDFKTVPMILDHREQWDDEALTEVLSYKPVPKQVWDNTDIAGPWLNFMRNALNTQIWSFKRPDFLTVSVTHGTALLALYDQAMWDKYRLTQLAGDGFRTNTLIVEQKAASAAAANYEDPAGTFSGEDNSVPALMRRGVVFMSCHNAIWEQAAALIKAGVNPDKLSHGALAAELTNHLVDGAVLIPGAVGTLPELQQAGFHYAT